MPVSGTARGRPGAGYGRDGVVETGVLEQRVDLRASVLEPNRAVLHLERGIHEHVDPGGIDGRELREVDDDLVRLPLGSSGEPAAGIRGGVDVEVAGQLDDRVAGADGVRLAPEQHRGKADQSGHAAAEQARAALAGDRGAALVLCSLERVTSG